MTLRPEIEKFVGDLEIFAQQKLNYPVEVGELLQIAMQSGLKGEFESLIFQVKFLVKTQELMKRIGPGADGFEKLTSEYQSSMKKSIDFLNVLVEKAPSDVARKLTDMFTLMGTDSMSRLMKLFFDLSWIKNWRVDGKPLPFETSSVGMVSSQDGSKEKESGERASAPLVRIQISALSGVALFVLLLFIDPPVTIFGWILSLGISLFLVYIVLQIYLKNRPSKS